MPKVMAGSFIVASSNIFLITVLHSTAEIFITRKRDAASLQLHNEPTHEAFSGGVTEAFAKARMEDEERWQIW